MNKISAVIITKNEAQNIGRCLDSLQNVADETIVVDSFSTDNTKSICENFNTTFVEKEFIDYSSQKNYGNELAQHPYILSIDADEALSEELIANISKLKKEGFEADGYYFNRLTNYCGQWIHYSGWYPDTKLRLFKKSKAKWIGEVHEDLALTNGSTQSLKGDILHYSYPTIGHHLKKMNSFTDMYAEEQFEKGKRVSKLEIIVAPTFEFFKKYFLKKGILDGYYGFVISVLSAHYKFYKYIKLRQLWLEKEGKR